MTHDCTTFTNSLILENIKKIKTMISFYRETSLKFISTIQFQFLKNTYISNRQTSLLEYRVDTYWWPPLERRILCCCFCSLFIIIFFFLFFLSISRAFVRNARPAIGIRLQNGPGAMFNSACWWPSQSGALIAQITGKRIKEVRCVKSREFRYASARIIDRIKYVAPNNVFLSSAVKFASIVNHRKHFVLVRVPTFKRETGTSGT